MKISISHTAVLVSLILIYATVEIICLNKLSVNYDEGQFATYGVSILKLQGNKDVATYDSKLPITAVNMLPRAVEQIFHQGLSKKDSVEDIRRGRYISLVISILLGLLIYHWSTILYGKQAGFFSLIMFLICPNFLAHGIFLSSDIFACFFSTLSFYFLWRYHQNKEIKTFLYMCGAVAFAEVSKFSMVHLFLIIPILMLMHSRKGNSDPKNKSGWKRRIALGAIFLGINWLVISGAHLFYEMFLPLNAYSFRSESFQKIQDFLKPISSYIRIPFPSSYVKSLDAVMYFDHLGGGKPGSLNGAPYLLGKNSEHGFWYYYFVVLFYKLPIPLLLFFATTMYLFVKRLNTAHFIKSEMYLLIPSCYFLLYMSFFYSTQIGIRHILIILPLLYVFIGYGFKHFDAPRFIAARNILLAWQVISVAWYFPHFLPYTNEFIPNKKYAYRKIADTNLCYGEGHTYLMKYLRENPTAKYLPAQIDTGKIVMEVNEMLDLDIQTQGNYNWTRDLDPKDHIHSQYLIFEISDSLASGLRNKYHQQ